MADPTIRSKTRHLAFNCRTEPGQPVFGITVDSNGSPRNFQGIFQIVLSSQLVGSVTRFTGLDGPGLLNAVRCLMNPDGTVNQNSLICIVLGTFNPGGCDTFISFGPPPQPSSQAITAFILTIDQFTYDGKIPIGTGSLTWTLSVEWSDID